MLRLRLCFSIEYTENNLTDFIQILHVYVTGIASLVGTTSRTLRLNMVKETGPSKTGRANTPGKMLKFRWRCHLMIMMISSAKRWSV